jgi:hypothetical protein
MFIKGGIKGENVTRINTPAAANCRMPKPKQKKTAALFSAAVHLQ